MESYFMTLQSNTKEYLLQVVVVFMTN